MLIASPVRSAVVETLSQIDDELVSGFRSDAEGAIVEDVRLNLPAWPEAWARSEAATEALVLRWIDPAETAIPFIRALFNLAGRFEPARGVTSLNPDGTFVFHLELKLAQLQS